MKICQHGAKIFNKMCSFEVSIRVLSLILIVSSTESLLYIKGLVKIHQHGTMIVNQMCIFEVSIGVLPLILTVSSKEYLL